MSVAARPPRPSFGFARRNGATLVAWREDGAEVAWREGVKPEVLSELRRYLGAPLRLVRHDAAGHERLLRTLYEQATTRARWLPISTTKADLKTLVDELPEPEDLLESEDDAPIIRLINALLTEAVKEGASDIHIEAVRNRLVVRFRIDGVLREVLSPRKRSPMPWYRAARTWPGSTSPRSAGRRMVASA